MLPRAGLPKRGRNQVTHRIQWLAIKFRVGKGQLVSLIMRRNTLPTCSANVSEVTFTNCIGDMQAMNVSLTWELLTNRAEHSDPELAVFFQGANFETTMLIPGGRSMNVLYSWCVFWWRHTWNHQVITARIILSCMMRGQVVHSVSHGAVLLVEFRTSTRCVRESQQLHASIYCKPHHSQVIRILSTLETLAL